MTFLEISSSCALPYPFNSGSIFSDNGRPKHFLTDSGESINPARDGISSQPEADVVAEMIAVLGDEIVGIASVLLCKLAHLGSYICEIHLCPSD